MSIIQIAFDSLGPFYHTKTKMQIDKNRKTEGALAGPLRLLAPDHDQSNLGIIEVCL